MSAWLYIAGAAPFILLGGLHVLYTVLDEFSPRRLAPKDKGVVTAMRMSPLGLTSQTTMWQAWIGFNLSHGIGAVGFGLLYLYLALFHAPFLADAGPLLMAAPVVASLYFLLALRYWFSVPAIGTAIGAALFWGGLLTA